MNDSALISLAISMIAIDGLVFYLFRLPLNDGLGQFASFVKAAAYTEQITIE